MFLTFLYYSKTLFIWKLFLSSVIIQLLFYVTVHISLFREVFWHEYAKIPRHTSHIEFEVDDNKKVHNVRFIGGCSGNTQGVASLVEGMDAEEVISRLKGIKCGFKNTSCPDQLSTALEEVLNK